MVERSVSLGLDARVADAMAHLRGTEEASCSGLTAFHVVEHLPFTTLADLLDEAFRVVIPGGVLILETPNPETMRVGATTFYYDPTHRNPLMPGVLELLVKHRGFIETEILRLHPFTQGLLEEKTADAAILNAVLFGAQDYAVIARRP
jgi:O-antigen chain-terminating methyltransferase